MNVRSLMALALLVGIAQADPLEFVLHNHDDGNAAPPKYGLRLDGLFNGDTNDVYTFDFDHAMSDMRLVVDDAAAPTKITISGKAYGGLNSGSGYSADMSKVGLWDIEFEYADNVSAVSNGYEVTGDSSSNNGSIKLIGTTSEFALADEQGRHSYSFRFLDAVHRGDGPWSGWGWLNHDWNQDGTIDSHVYASDWLFTGTPNPVPEPGTWALFGAAAIGFAVYRRRRNAA